MLLKIYNTVWDKRVKNLLVFILPFSKKSSSTTTTTTAIGVNFCKVARLEPPRPTFQTPRLSGF